MIDTHCHLNFKAFNKDYDQVIKRAFAAGVTKIINVGTKLDSSQKAVELAKKYENLYAIVGIHPHHADKVSGDWIVELEELARHPKVIGIGECGMDYYRYQSNAVVDEKLQREVFIRQIELAYRLKLPLQIHNRQAGKDIIDILINHKSYLLNPPAHSGLSSGSKTGGPGMFHCFSGSLGFLKKVLDLGFYVGFDGNITYQGLAPGEETELPELVKYTPLERILLETDSPFLSPEPHRGSRNEPKNVIIVGKAVAQIKGVPAEKIKEITIKNTNDIFFPKNIHSLSN